MKEQYCILYGNDGFDNQNEDDDFVLSLFDGKCFNCGEKGHKASDCPKPKTKNSGKDGEKGGGCGSGESFNGICKNCSKKGHNKAYAGIWKQTKIRDLHGISPKVKVVWFVQRQKPLVVMEI